MKRPRVKDVVKTFLIDDVKYLLKKVPTHNDLYISEDGLIVLHKGIRRKLTNLHPAPGRRPYKTVGVDGKTVYVHRLVAMAFHGVSSKKLVIHLDNNPENNYYKNLTWGTPYDHHINLVFHDKAPFRKYTEANVRDRIKSKIKNEQIPPIVERLKKGETLRSIAQEFNTSDMSIHRIKVRYILQPQKRIEAIQRLQNMSNVS